MKTLYLPALLLVLNGLPARADEAAEPAPARIRVFMQNSVIVGLYPNRSCYPPKLRSGNLVRAGAGNPFRSLFGSVSNKSIGMPESLNTRQLSQRSRLGSTAYYQEFPLMPGQAVTFSASLNAVNGPHCDTQAASFTPQAGADYEAMLNVADRCRLNLVQLPSGSAVDAEPAAIPDLQPALPCQAPPR
ncbi:hypothetical protein [Chromobacterium sphagni]|uniref:Secreted protein n=1 Tax=Chromobacterium sphagni TaxID=1903179 RepID=A0A1S1X217_9NEIS|nr:hypothetical protein [Chromobacterium sphagni]OHX13206.1 hypothetical protein BI347_06585 [Chromobacterium sphagni]OHX20998.1 hypothetical protein BI344_00100 [Chromobacterium sphagni]